LAAINTLESRDQALDLFHENYIPAYEKATDILKELTQLQQQDTDAQIEEGDTAYTDTLISIAVALITSIVVILFLIILISKTLVPPVKELEQAAIQLAQGDLKVAINYKSRDELGALSEAMRKAMAKFSLYIDEVNYALGEIAHNNFSLREPQEHFLGDFSAIEANLNKLVSDMSETMSQIKSVAEQVSFGADQVSSGAQALAQGATEQASSVEELSSTISDVSTQVLYNADKATKASEIAMEAAGAIKASNDQMQHLMVAMDNINAKSSEISKIIKTIEDIAFQTNILALNAAVEAARAGAAGKGFAVVADEVRNLAGKSAEAAKNTTMLIEDSVSSVFDGVKLADETAKDLLGAVDSVEKTTALISDISKASSEQAAAISQINIGVEQISAVVQNNSATSQESAAASEELSSQAGLLNRLVSKFTLQ
jgi:methyl-accepting chemotaxis protein